MATAMSAAERERHPLSENSSDGDSDFSLGIKNAVREMAKGSASGVDVGAVHLD